MIFKLICVFSFLFNSWNFVFLFFLFWLHRILVPWQGIEPMPPDVKAVLTTGLPGKSHFHELSFFLFCRIQRKSSTYSISLQVMNCGRTGGEEEGFIFHKEMWRSWKESSLTFLFHPRPTLNPSANAIGSTLRKKRWIWPLVSSPPPTSLLASSLVPTASSSPNIQGDSHKSRMYGLTQ